MTDQTVKWGRKNCALAGELHRGTFRADDAYGIACAFENVSHSSRNATDAGVQVIAGIGTRSTMRSRCVWSGAGLTHKSPARVARASAPLGHFHIVFAGAESVIQMQRLARIDLEPLVETRLIR